MYKCERCDWTGSASELGHYTEYRGECHGDLRGKHYRVARSADMMLRTSKKSKKKELPEGSKANFTQDQYNTGRRKSQYEYQRKTYSRTERRKARQV